MKLLITLITSFLSTLCFSQKGQSTEPKHYSFVAGISIYKMFSSSNDIRRYDLNTLKDSYYYDISNNHNSSSLLQLNGEIQFENMYVHTGLGMRTETINFEAENFQDYYHFAFSQSYNSVTTRSIIISEKHTTLIGSLELGTYFMNNNHPLRIGMGLGFDINFYLAPQIEQNELNKEETIYMTNFQGTYTTITTHGNESSEWDVVIAKIQMPLVSPKITFTTSYHFHKKFSLLLKAQMRLVRLKTSGFENKKVFEYPVGIGFHYHF
ncbi:MAG: hypothetical protein COA38_06435 [Fluviicola sp.]|nr:MAG: hypothetical protein COA38_06435 [Fluviicola sp.]